MALLVCYSSVGVVDWTDSKIYMEQSFYEQLFEWCKRKRGFPLLEAVAALGYDDEITFIDGQLEGLITELGKLLEAPSFHHWQTAPLIEVAQAAQAKGLGLAVAGDMFPEMK